MLKDLCLIIPTHNRPEYISRAVSYLVQINYSGDVCICDSSAVPWRGAVPLNVEYRNVPDESFPDKVLSVITEKQHKLFILCPDDDFIVLSSVYSGYEFMKMEPGCSCYTGTYFDYLKEEKTGDIYAMTRCIPRNIFSRDPVCRAVKLMSNYHMMLWNMFRRDTLITAFKGIRAAEFSNDNYIELMLAITAAIDGSIKIAAVPWMVRERSVADDSWGKRHAPLSRTKIKTEYDLHRDYCNAADYFEKTYGTMGHQVWVAGIESYFEMLTPVQIRNITRRLARKVFWRVMRLFGKSRHKHLITADQTWAENAVAIRGAIINGVEKKDKEAK
jgi:glycosyltransferase domain-containing protein